MAAPVAPAAPPAPVLPPTAFLMALKNNVNVSSACVAGVDRLLLDPTHAKQAEFFSGRVADALNLLLPPVLNDYVFATDKRAGAARLIHEPPLFALGVPDSCAYVPGTHYCQIDVINVFVKWGVCVPQECSIQDVFTATFPPIVQKLAARSHGVCGPVNRDATLFIAAEPLSPAAVSTLVFLALLALTALAATLMDVYGARWWPGGSLPLLTDARSPLVKVARCFSLAQNYARLMAPPRSGPFVSLEAVRVLAMCQIILGHMMWFNIHVAGISNPRETLGFFNQGFLSTGTGLITNSSLFAVDAFFAIAGFFAILMFVKELEKRMPRLQGQTLRQTALIWQMALVSWLRRYLRLTPAFAVVLAVFTTLSPYLESAPPSPTGLGHEVSLCEKHWWQNLLYVQNFLAPSAYEMCYIPSWWLAVIQQLFLLIPFVALLAYWRPRVGVAACLLACVASYAYSFQKGMAEQWRINALDRPGFPNFFNHFYIMPFTRMPTFLLGCVGAVLWHQRGDRFVAYMNRGRVALKSWGMIAAGLVILGLVEWGPKRELAYAPGKWTQAESSLYVTLSMSGWVLGLALICAVLFAGQGGLLKTLLEQPFWSVLARLVYSCYLVHPMTIWLILGSRGGQPFHFSLISVTSELLGFAAMSGLAAVVFYFFVEAPFGEAERLLFKPPARKKETAGEGAGAGADASEPSKGVGGTEGGVVVVAVPVELSESAREGVDVDGDGGSDTPSSSIAQ